MLPVVGKQNRFGGLNDGAAICRIDFFENVRSWLQTCPDGHTDQVEAFGLNECWLDVTGSAGLFGDGVTIANDIRARIRHELGLTVYLIPPLFSTYAHWFALLRF